MITIKSKKEGFRRCGVSHPAAAVEYPNDRFTDAELARLMTEPMLTVTVVPFPVFPPACATADMPVEGSREGDAAGTEAAVLKVKGKGKGK